MEEGKGYITVNVRTAGGALPVDNAMVTVRSNGGSVIAVMFTDMSGTSDVLSLDTPPRENSLSPDNTGAVAGLYTVTTDREGYYSVVNTNVPIYEGVNSIQLVILVPVAEGTGAPSELTRFNDGQMPNL